MNIDQILSSLEDVHRCGQGWTALCPAHDDQRPSLSIGVGNDGKVLLKCHRGCNPEDIVQAIGLTLADLFPDNTPYQKGGNGSPPPGIVTTQPQKETPLPEVEIEKARNWCTYLQDNFDRFTKGLPWDKEAVKKAGVGYDPDTGRFVFVHRDGDGKIVNVKHHKGPDGQAPYSIWRYGQNRLYPLHLLKDNKPEFVIHCEGEKDAVTLISQGFPAITGTTGAESVPPDLRPLSRFNAAVVILDNDEAGKTGSVKVADAILAQCPETEVFISYWPEDRPEGYDSTSFFQGGGTADGFEEQMLKEIAIYQPTEPETQPQPTVQSRPEILSDAHKKEVPSERNLVFRTAREIAVSTPERPPWVVPGLLARGAITEVDGKIKAAGKTTFLAHLCSAVLEGKAFLDKPTEKTRVVYLTEQSDTTFREALQRAGLLGREDFWILSWHDAVGVSWNDVVKAAVNQCHEKQAGVLVVDTLGQWAGIRGSGENDAGEALATIQPLQIAAGVHNLAVVVARHERKSGGEVGDSGRGSSAFGGAVDIILSLGRAEGNSNPNIRVIHALSRFTETPDTLAIELTNEGYIALGSEAAVALTQAKQAILDVAPVTQEAAKKEDELLDAAQVKRTTGRDALNELMEAGLIERVGAGKRGDPYRYRATPEKDSDATQFYRPSERKDAVQST